MLREFLKRYFSNGVLGKAAIEQEIAAGRIIIEPYDQRQLNSNSYNVRLAPTLYRITSPELDFKKQYEYETITIPECGYVLQPGGLYLGCTVERTSTPWHAPEYNGRSTTGRYFLFSHVTAGYGDCGFSGHWTLELVVLRPLRIYPYMKVGQIAFQTIKGEIVDRYQQCGGHYNTTVCQPRAGLPNNV